MIECSRFCTNLISRNMIRYHVNWQPVSIHCELLRFFKIEFEFQTKPWLSKEFNIKTNFGVYPLSFPRKHTTRNNGISINFISTITCVTQIELHNVSYSDWDFLKQYKTKTNFFKTLVLFCSSDSRRNA